MVTKDIESKKSEILEENAIAKEIKKNPREVAENIIKKLNEFDIFENLNIAGPGFINISIKDEFLFKYLNEIQEDISKNIIEMNTIKGSFFITAFYVCETKVRL